MQSDQAEVMDSYGSASGAAAAAGRAGAGVLPVERWLIRRMLARLHDPSVRVVLWNGDEIAPPGASCAARVVIRDRAGLYRLLLDPDVQFGELYSEGRIEVEGNLVAFIEAVNRAASVGHTFADHVPGRLGRARVNGLGRSRANVHHHYNIGNAFYRLWLDDQLVYTCAYFPTPDATLERAQIAKMDHVCRKLRLRPGQRVVEAGCGWGALALHMVKHYGVSVKAYNISREQITLARRRAAEEGVSDRVEFIEDDWRHIGGVHDAFVSVGMLEHVGPSHYRELGKVINRSLAPTGLALIHSIGRNRAMRPDPWITSRIFPGGYTPSISEMTEIFEPQAFSVLDVENLRLHYALTLRHWLERFEVRREEVRGMFNERFVRMWRLYLAGSIAAFTTGWMQLFQVVIGRADNNEIPLTREHLYRAQG